MKILIVDRDVVTANLLKSRLVPMGHSVEIHADRTEGLDKMVAAGWDVVMVDPSPMTTAKPMVVNIRRQNHRHAYMILLSDTLGSHDALTAGFNAFLSKPVDMNAMLDLMDGAKYLMGLQRHLADDKIDFPSAGGVIAKSAFNQLFLSSMERADRYGEEANIIFITFENYTQVAAESGQYEADTVSARLAQSLVQMRRQTDIIAQIKPNEYALLLLRPMTESEPVEAANRFAESLSKCHTIPSTADMSVNIKVSLMRLPVGQLAVDHRMVLRNS